MLLLDSGLSSSFLLRTVLVSICTLSSVFGQTTTTTIPDIPPLEQTTFFFTNATAPEGLSNECTSALLVEIGCAPVVAGFRTSSYIPPNALQEICTSQCSNDLQAFRTSVAASCVDETFEYNEGEAPIPVAMLADMLAFSFNYVCLKEGTKWCNEHFADSAAFGEPEIPHPYGFDTPIPTTQPDPCDLCAIKGLQHLASSHLFDGPVLRGLSLYESLTSSCSVTGYPLTTDTPTYPTSTQSMPTTTNTGPLVTPTCAGTTYTIDPADDCNTIARSQGIGTGWLLIDNDLPLYCHEFPSSGELCLINKCSTTTVPGNSTCEMIADSHNITEAQLKSWNPVLDGGCHNLPQMSGHELCVEAPGLDGPYTTPAPLPLPPTMILTPAPAPTDVAIGTNSTYCGQFHQAVLGEYCNMLVLQYSIPLSDFRFLNTAINDNCTNLFAGESYCVKPVGDINTYFGRPGITSIMTPTHTLTDDEFATSALATWTKPPSPPNTDLPLAEDSRNDCMHYIDGVEITKFNLTGTLYTNHCQYLARFYQVDLDEVEIWNPSIGNASLANCTLVPGNRYCGRLYDQPREKIIEVSPELPIREGAHPNCTLYEEIDAMWSCTEILETFSLTIAEFYRLNSAVGADCAGLWPNYRYCVSDTPLVIDDGSGTTTTDEPTPTTTTTGSTDPTTTTTPTAPGPTHSGQPANCNQWHVVVAGDTCATIISLYSLSSADFYAWNPAVDSQCINNFWLESAYCVGISSASTTTTDPTPTTTTTTTPTPPGPTHEGQPSNCNRWHLVVAGDDCTTIIDQSGISSSDFYTWNPAVDSQCTTNFWGGYAYCIGVGSGTPTTTTATTTTGPLIPHITPPGPTHTGQPATCNGWHLVQPGEDCGTIMDAYFLTISEFFSWNPAVNVECTSNFWASYAYCVSIVGHSTRSTIPPATTTTTSVPIPSPVHDNSIISSCNSFALPNAGDWCALFADRHGITVNQLGAWNSALGVGGSECGSMFWGGYYYCIGISS